MISKNNEEISHKFAELSVKIEDLRSNLTSGNSLDNMMEMLQKKSLDGNMAIENDGEKMEEEGS